ncbi:MAG TPA: histidine phosphatase family protein [Gammaproteobacteria bacterium]|nr:histidine phosphatase family protein [Gammaproteobacteria bacterium]
MAEQRYIDVLRHGEPEGGRCIRGQRDDRLSAAGWAQMRAAVAHGRLWQRVVSSPLHRCADFASAYAKAHQLPLCIEPRLKEIGFGPWEGHKPAKLQRDDPERYTRFRRDPVAHLPPGAEPVTAFAARVGAAWDELLLQSDARAVLVVAHAGVIRALLNHVLGAPAHCLFRSQVGYACFTRFVVDSGGLVRLVCHNVARLPET